MWEVLALPAEGSSPAPAHTHQVQRRPSLLGGPSPPPLRCLAAPHVAWSAHALARERPRWSREPSSAPPPSWGSPERPPTSPLLPLPPLSHRTVLSGGKGVSVPGLLTAPVPPERFDLVGARPTGSRPSAPGVLNAHLEPDGRGRGQSPLVRPAAPRTFVTFLKQDARGARTVVIGSSAVVHVSVLHVWPWTPRGWPPRAQRGTNGGRRRAGTARAR